MVVLNECHIYILFYNVYRTTNTRATLLTPRLKTVLAVLFTDVVLWLIYV